MVYDYYKEMGTKKKKGRIHYFIALLLLFLGASTITGIYLEYLQFAEIGNFTSVFLTNLKYKVFFSAIILVVIFTCIYFTNLVIKKNYHSYSDNDEDQPVKKFINMPLALLIGLIGSLLTKDFFYDKALMFLNNVNFNKKVPLFGYDIGYFMFTRPFLISIYDFVSSLWFFVIIYTAAYYFVLMAAQFERITIGGFKFDNFKFKSLLTHNIINVAIFFFIKAFSFKFNKEGILYSTFVNVRGAGYVDVNIWLRFFKIAPIVLILIVISSIFFLSKGKIKNALLTIAVYPAMWFLVSVIATIIQTFIVQPSATAYESEYLKHNISMTKDAYNITDIKPVDFGDVKELTPQLLERNVNTKNNIRILDYQSTLENDRQLQGITNFYTFNDGDFVNYNENGKNSAVFMTAREIDQKRLPDNQYISRKFRYTHGYGVVINPINKITAQGQVEFIMGDLNSTKSKIKEPSIYYGELTSDYVLTNAAKDVNEFHYNGDTETRYKGNGGIKLTLLNRFLFAFKYADLNMLISSFVDNNTKILINRQILDRAQKVLPFLNIDTDPYIMIGDDGKLKWIIDAYTTSNDYPYAQNTTISGIGTVNYIRNSIKVIIDAYDGSMKVYIIDKNDPIAAVYKKIYPEIFSDEAIPEDAKKYMKYPEMLFKVQTNMLKKYHLSPDDVNTFYSNLDLWDISKHYEGAEGTSQAQTKSADIDPFYNMIKLPAGVGDKEEFVLMRPFSPSNKNNMSSWLAVRNSYENYGRLVLYRFSKNTNILGPYQVAVKISQNMEISSIMTLLGQKGSTAYKGNLMVVPIEDSILYVEPIYVKASVASATPEIRKIVVGYQKGDELHYGIGDNLDKALSDLFIRSGISPTIAGKSEETKNPNTTNNTQSTATTPQPTVAPNSQNNGTESKNARDALLKDLSGRYDSVKKQVDDMGNLLEQLKKIQ